MKKQLAMVGLVESIKDGIGKAAVRQLQSNMDSVSRGRTYIINGRKHIAAKVGDAPNNLSHSLRNGFRYADGVVSNGVNYIKYVEPRHPNMSKVIDRELVDNVVKDVLRRYL